MLCGRRQRPASKRPDQFVQSHTFLASFCLFSGVDGFQHFERPVNFGDLAGIYDGLPNQIRGEFAMSSHDFLPRRPWLMTGESESSEGPGLETLYAVHHPQRREQQETHR